MLTQSPVDALRVLSKKIIAELESTLAELINQKLNANKISKADYKKNLSAARGKITKYTKGFESLLQVLEQPSLPGTEEPSPEKVDETNPETTGIVFKVKVELNKDTRSRKKWVAAVNAAAGREYSELDPSGSRVVLTYRPLTDTEAAKVIDEVSKLDFVLETDAVPEEPPPPVAPPETDKPYRLLLILSPENQLKDERIAKIEEKIERKVFKTSAHKDGIDALIACDTVQEAEELNERLDPESFPFLTGYDILDAAGAPIPS